MTNARRSSSAMNSSHAATHAAPAPSASHSSPARADAVSPSHVLASLSAMHPPPIGSLPSIGWTHAEDDWFPPRRILGSEAGLCIARRSVGAPSRIVSESNAYM